MRGFRFILGRRALIVFLALLVMTGAFLGVPAATRTLAESPPPGSQEVSAASADSFAVDGPILDPSGTSPLLQGGSSAGTWTLLDTGSASPSGRSGHAMAATPSGVLLFGGGWGGSDLGDTWTLTLARIPDTDTGTWFGTWTQRTGSPSSPSGRSGHAMAATPSGVLLFGGLYNITIKLADTWLFNNANNTWSLITITGSSPSARFGHAMVSTPSGVLLFGGNDGDDRNDTWTLTLARIPDTDTGTWFGTWTQRTGSPSIPSARDGHAMAYDSQSGKVILFGGQDASIRNDTWAYDYVANTWTNRSPANSPSKRTDHAIAATPSGNVILFGGFDGSARRNDTWAYDYVANTWTNRSPANSPSERWSHAMAATPSGDALLFGGTNGNPDDLLDDTWLYDPPPTIVLAPATATILAGTSTNYALTAYDTSTNTWDITSSGTYSITSGAGGTWTNTYTYTASKAGIWTVTASYGDQSTTATLEVTHSNTVDHLVLTPATATILASTPTDYTLTAHDTSTNTWDVTSSGTYSITSGAEGTWTNTNHYTSSKAGQWTVTATYGGQSTTATLEVTHSNTVAYLVLTPATATILAGTATAYTLIAHDTYTNTWDVTSSGTYSIDPGAEGTWTNTNHYTSGKAGQWTVTAILGSNTATALLTITLAPSIVVTSPTAGAHWPIGSPREITWTSTDLNSTTLTILLARDGVNFTETLTHQLTSTVTQYTWTVTGPGTINAKVRVQQEATMGVSTGFFTTATAYPYSGTSTLTTSDPWLEISGGTGTGTLWVTPLTPTNTSDPNLNQFLQETGQRSALFFDISQEGLTETLTIVLHFNHQLGEETFQLYRWDGAGWIKVDGIPPSPNLADHTFTFTIAAGALDGTPFGLGGNPAAMPGMSPWGLALLSLALLGVGGWWFLRRRRLA